MKNIIRLLAILTCCCGITSCSCAIYLQSWKPEADNQIINSDFHQAAKDNGFVSHRSSMLGYKRKDIYFSYSTPEGVSLYSSFCPTPLTLLSSGTDFNSWEIRCNQAEADISRWFSQRGIRLKAAHAVPKNN